MPPGRKDEIGELAIAFNNMVQKRFEAEEELRRMREELEARVVERLPNWPKRMKSCETENAERKRAEETWRESEEKFRQLADNITDVFWMTSPDLKTVSLRQPGLSTIWGRSSESLFADPEEWSEAILPEDRERVFGVFATLSGKRAGSQRGISGSAS